MATTRSENSRNFALTVAFTNIPAASFARRVEIYESVADASRVGILVKYPDDNFTASFLIPPSQQPLIIGNKIAHSDAYGEILGWPAQTGGNARAADVYVQVAAATGTTTITVTEYN